MFFNVFFMFLMSDIEHVFYSHINVFTTMQFHHHITTTTITIIIIIIIIVNPLEFRGEMFLMFIFMFLMSNIKHVFLYSHIDFLQLCNSPSHHHHHHHHR